MEIKIVKTYSKRIIPVVALLLAAVLVLITFTAYAAPNDSVVLKVAPTGTTTTTTGNNCPSLIFSNWTKGWVACDENNGAASGPTLVEGPATPPLGIGSAEFVSTTSANGPHIFNAFEPGLPLSAITALSYQTYSAGTNPGRPGFFINIDYDLTDLNPPLDWQGRLVMVPSQPGCATLNANTWDTLDVIANPTAKCFYSSGTPRVNGVLGTKLFTQANFGSWNEVKAAYPQAGIHPTVGGLGFKLGSGFSLPVTAYVDNFHMAYTSSGGARDVIWDFEPQAAMTVAANTPNACATNTVTIGFEDVPGAYGYQFQVSYSDALVTATGAFNNSFFDINPGDSPNGWKAQCANGTCKFAGTLVDPKPEVSGTGPVGTITLTAKQAGTTNLAVSNVELTDRDGTVIQTALPAAALEVGVCGTATISGRVSLQGRANPMDKGTVTLTPENGGTAVSVDFDPLTGLYSLPPVLYPAGGANFVLKASHGLYLSNQKTLNVATTSITGQNTRLLGGDANNSGKVEITDLGCIGGNFGPTTTSTPAMGNCGGTGSPDINLDLKVNIQDLSIAGGNYDKSCAARLVSASLAGAAGGAASPPQ